MVDAHSELMTQYPWGFAGTTPNASDNAPDSGAFDGDGLVFRDTGRLPGERRPLLHGDRRLRPARRGRRDRPRPLRAVRRRARAARRTRRPRRCPATATTGRSAAAPAASCATASACAARRETLWIAVAGSDNSAAEARREHAAADPTSRSGCWPASAPTRAALGRWSKVSLPGNRLLQESVDWGKQNLADLTQEARRTSRSAGPTRARSRRSRARCRGSAGSARASPTTPGCSRSTASTPRTRASRSASSGRSRTTCARCATSPTCSTTAPASSCTRWSPTARSGMARTRARPTRDGRPYDFNTDEIVKFPAAVALIWRWTGDDAVPRRDARLHAA